MAGRNWLFWQELGSSLWLGTGFVLLSYVTTIEVEVSFGMKTQPSDLSITSDVIISKDIFERVCGPCQGSILDVTCN